MAHANIPVGAHERAAPTGDSCRQARPADEGYGANERIIKVEDACVKRPILESSYADLVDLVGSLGAPGYRADQVLRWIWKGGATSFDQMTDLPLPFRQKLADRCRLFTMEPVEERVSRDGQTRKVLFRLEDGRSIESAYMVYEATRTGRERRTVCVSTQVGCSIRCPFCATGQQGFERNLSPGEILEQVLHFAWLAQTAAHHQSMAQPLEAPAEAPPAPSEDAPPRPAPARRPLTNVVFMGMGEPLAAYEAVWTAISHLNSPKGLGLGARQITVSTAGLVPQIQRLAREDIHVELAVSLHAATDRVRDLLVPVNKRYPLAKLVPACREYLKATGRRPTFEYALFNGINDSPDQAGELARLLAGLECHVNLIPGNPTASKEFRPSGARRVAAFQRKLRETGISNTLRQSRGADIEAGCGQLRSRRLGARARQQAAR